MAGTCGSGSLQQFVALGEPLGDLHVLGVAALDLLGLAGRA